MFHKSTVIALWVKDYMQKGPGHPHYSCGRPLFPTTRPIRLPSRNSSVPSSCWFCGWIMLDPVEWNQSIYIHIYSYIMDTPKWYVDPPFCWSLAHLDLNLQIKWEVGVQIPAGWWSCNPKWGCPRVMGIPGTPKSSICCLGFSWFFYYKPAIWSIPIYGNLQVASKW